MSPGSGARAAAGRGRRRRLLNFFCPRQNNAPRNTVTCFGMRFLCLWCSFRARTRLLRRAPPPPPAAAVAAVYNSQSPATPLTAAFTYISCYSPNACLSRRSRKETHWQWLRHPHSQSQSSNPQKPARMQPASLRLDGCRVQATPNGPDRRRSRLHARGGALFLCCIGRHATTHSAAFRFSSGLCERKIDAPSPHTLHLTLALAQSS